MSIDAEPFRRSYNTGLANAGVNVQTAMRLAGHKNASTHMRYVLMAETLETPAAALPDLVQAAAMPKPLPFVANYKPETDPQLQSGSQFQGQWAIADLNCEPTD